MGPDVDDTRRAIVRMLLYGAESWNVQNATETSSRVVVLILVERTYRFMNVVIGIRVTLCPVSSFVLDDEGRMIMCTLFDETSIRVMTVNCRVTLS
jgi:hypothetical protein